ncbi:MAG: YegP family protein [Ignavibacteriaceae bacterium]
MLWASCKNGIKSVGNNGKNKNNYVISKAKNGKVHFNLIAGNKEIIGTSQMYASRDTLRSGIKSVMKNCKSKVEQL